MKKLLVENDNRGDTLTINAQIYVVDWRDELGGTYAEYADSQTLVAMYYSPVGDFEIGGNGSVTNGRLNFTIGIPEHLISITQHFCPTGWASGYDDFDISNQIAQVATLAFGLNNKFSVLTRVRNVYLERTDSGNTFVQEKVEYLYVDRDVTISGTGKELAHLNTPSFTETHTTKSFVLNLKKGWNTILSKQERISVRDTEEDKWIYTINRTVALSEPTSVRWIIEEEFDWDATPSFPPANHTPLTGGQWTDADFTNVGVHWYSFQVTARTRHYIWWNDVNDGDDTKTAEIVLGAWYANGTRIFAEREGGWEDPQSFLPTTSGTVYIMARPRLTGTYSITFTTIDVRPSVEKK